MCAEFLGCGCVCTTAAKGVPLQSATESVLLRTPFVVVLQPTPVFAAVRVERGRRGAGREDEQCAVLRRVASTVSGSAWTPDGESACDVAARTPACAPYEWGRRVLLRGATAAPPGWGAVHCVCLMPLSSLVPPHFVYVPLLRLVNT